MNNQNQDQGRHHQFTQNQQMGFGLTRYRSAPSSYFASLLSDDAIGNDEDALDRLLNPRAVSPETQRIFSRFMNGPDDATMMIQEEEEQPSQSLFNPQASPQLTYHHHHHQGNNSDAPASSFKPNHGGNTTIEASNNSGLVRYNSSPAGFFASLNMENEIGAMRAMGTYGVGNNTSNNISAEASVSSTSRFKSPMYYPPMNPSSSNMITIDTIPEIEPKGRIGIKFENSWDDSEFLSDSFLRGMSDANASDDHHQNHRLAHHLSLPKTSSEELSAVENIMLQDSVPCKIRAKRGFATHPRSIAERVRRTKISERMRKLQELVPNMDKVVLYFYQQTSTSDMLDLAVDYIKDLQRQVKALSDVKAKCTCCS